MDRTEQKIFFEFYKERDKNEPKAYVSYLLANLCMPTLTKLKPASLIHIDKKQIFDRVQFLWRIHYEIEVFHCKVAILYENNDSMVLFIYQKELLAGVIQSSENQDFLKRYGYSAMKNSTGQVISLLKLRYHEYSMRSLEEGQKRNAQMYPHEIGIFLGYPVRDVEDFIRFQGKYYLASGPWKVYHDDTKALATFEEYRKVRDMAIRGILAGKQLRDLWF